MNANPHEALVAGIIFGAVACLLVQGAIWLVREWVVSWRAVEQAQEILGCEIPAADDREPRHWSEADGFNRHWAALAEHTANAERRLSALGDVVPIQRDRRGGA